MMNTTLPRWMLLEGERGHIEDTGLRIDCVFALIRAADAWATDGSDAAALALREAVRVLWAEGGTMGLICGRPRPEGRG